TLTEVEGSGLGRWWRCGSLAVKWICRVTDPLGSSGLRRRHRFASSIAHHSRSGGALGPRVGTMIDASSVSALRPPSPAYHVLVRNAIVPHERRGVRVRFRMQTRTTDDELGEPRSDTARIRHRHVDSRIAHLLVRTREV